MRQWWSAFWDRPPGWALLAATVAVCLAGLWALSYPTPNGWILVLGCFWPTVVIAACWLTRTAAFLVQTKTWSAWLLAVPAVAVVSAALAVFDAPLQARWSLAAGDFSAAVDEIRAGTDSGRERRIGSYDVGGVRMHGDNVYFVVPASGFLNDDGVAYLPNGEPTTPDPVGEGVRVWHLRGPWYSFSAGW